MSEEQALAAVRAFLARELGCDAANTFPDMCPDGDEGAWAFWLTKDDTTSYLHADGRIEWLGTTWEPESGS